MVAAMTETESASVQPDHPRLRFTGLRSAERVGHALREARLAAGAAQQDIADASGVPRSTVATVERAARDVRLGTIMPMLRSLGYEIAFLPVSSRRFPWEEQG